MSVTGGLVMKRLLCALAVALASIAGSAGAVTIDFQSGTHWAGSPSTPYLETHYLQDGVLFVGNESWGPNELNPNELSAGGGRLHLDLDSHSAGQARVTFQNGSRFHANSFFMLPALGYWDMYDSTTNAYLGTCTFCTDVSFTGYRNGKLVSQLFFSSAIDQGFQLLNFRNIDTLLIESWQFWTDPPGISSVTGDIHFEMTSLNLSPIPLPASLPLMLVGLVGLGWFGNKRRPSA